MCEPNEVLDAIRAAATSGEVEGLVARARARVASAVAAGGGEDLAGLLGRLGDVERAGQERRDRQHQTVLDVLRELGDHGTRRALIDGTTDALRRLGFGRSSIEWLDDGGTDGAGAAADPEECPVRCDPIRRNVVRRRSAVLVPRDAGAAGPPAPAAGAGEVAAPVVVGREVAAVLRAGTDHRLDETDRQVIATFADGLGQLIRCHGLYEELAAVRVALTDVIDRASFPAPTAWPAAPPRREEVVGPTRSDRHSRGLLSSLTPREVEILRHLAAGETNARIARRLVISEGTVKSHVKNLLRKLDAANRAEAVSIWHRASAGSSPCDSR